ncbi:hypothetical protein BDR26DRAFT_393328, partial [Obelidium mucronatum]
RNGAKGTKQVTPYHKQAFIWVIRICQAILGVKIDFDCESLSAESTNIRANVGQEYQINDVNRQATKRKAALSYEDQIAARKYFYTSNRVNPFDGIVFLNMGRAMMTRAQERRFTEYLDLDANEHYTASYTDRNKSRIPKMMVTELLMDKNKLSHLFSCVGQDDKSIVSAATHRNAAFSVDVAVAQFLFQKHSVLKIAWPPFEDGYDVCKRYALMPGTDPLKPMPHGNLNQMLQSCYTTIGRYIAGLVTHLERKEGSYWRRALGCPNEEIEDSNWSSGQQTGKKAVYKSVYNKGFSTDFIVASTDHGVCEQKEVYFIPWDVDVPQNLLDSTWPELDPFFQLIAASAPGFGDSESFQGLARALSLFKKRLYQGTAHNIYTGILKENNPFLKHDVFQSPDFKLVLKRVSVSCNEYTTKCDAAGTCGPAPSDLVDIGISGERRLLSRLDSQDAIIGGLNTNVESLMAMVQALLDRPSNV